MTARQIFMLRTGATADVAAQYIRLSESRIKAFLGCDHIPDIPDAVAEIAIYLYRQDAVKVQDGKADVVSESNDTGSVSVSRTYAKTSEQISVYEDLIDRVLQKTFTPYRKAGRARFL